MGTITFEVHHITLTSSKNILATIFKSILIPFCFSCSLHIFPFKHIMHGHIGEIKETPNYVSQTSYFCYASATPYRAY